MGGSVHNLTASRQVRKGRDRAQGTTVTAGPHSERRTGPCRTITRRRRDRCQQKLHTGQTAVTLKVSRGLQIRIGGNGQKMSPSEKKTGQRQSNETLSACCLRHVQQRGHPRRTRSESRTTAAAGQPRGRKQETANI